MPPLHVFELRNYTLKPDQRDVLIDLFEREFVESQDALGSYVLGTFRNADDPDRFVWLRGFENMETRRSALEAFYTGPVWQSHRSEANATMIDSDNVLLLRPHAGSLPNDASARPAVGAMLPESLIVATTYFLAPHGEGDFAAFFTRDVAPYLAKTGGAPFATFVTEHSPNTFPRLPVRENETVFVSLARFESADAHAAQVRALEAWPAWARVAATVAQRARAGGDIAPAADGAFAVALAASMVRGAALRQAQGNATASVRANAQRRLPEPVEGRRLRGRPTCRRGRRRSKA